MLDLLFRLIAKILKLWEDLPEKAKDEIIESLVSAYETIFRAFYRASQKE
jgi:hypothetical protein